MIDRQTTQVVVVVVMGIFRVYEVSLLGKMLVYCTSTGPGL